MSTEFDFTEPDHFCTGTVGPKGQRVFYLQAREAGEVVSLKLEKQQVTALADYLERLLEDLPEMRAPRADAPLLLEPVEPAFAVGGLGVIYNERADRIILVAEELVVDGGGDDDDDVPAEPDDDETPAEARYHLSRPQVLSFIEQARLLVAAGRPPCPYCGRPLDPVSGFCPCVN
jgi:uncharacterized repeat protein (TIGR03847 family)